MSKHLVLDAQNLRDLHSHTAMRCEYTEQIHALAIRIAEARRLLSDKRAHGRIDATRGAWEAERDRWMEVTR